MRFLFGGAITAITGMLANRYGPVFGGLFLAFPALFPASATLLESHEREKKRRAGIANTSRGREAAALDARGAAIGSIGLVGFALIAWKLLPISKRRGRAFRSACGVDRDFGSDLAAAQAPSFSPQRPRRRGIARACFVKRRLTFTASRFSSVFDSTPCFCGTFYVENSIFLTQMPVVVDEELFQFLHEFLA